MPDRLLEALPERLESFKVKSGDLSHPKPSFKKSVRRFCFGSWLRMRARRLYPHIMQSVEGCTTIMDLGCGDTILTEFIGRTSEKEVLGVDTLDTNLTGIPVLIYDGQSLPFEDKSIDAAIVIYVLHHCQDIDSVLEEIKRVTKKKIIIVEEVYRGAMDRFLLHFHDTIGNRMLSSKMDIPLNFQTIESWKETFTRQKLEIRNSFRIKQYPLMNLTHQILFELQVN
jgi:SAM-dependent methyltransferase